MLANKRERGDYIHMLCQTNQ